MRRIADVEHEQLQLNTYLALDATRHSLTHQLVRYSREYYQETTEHEIESGLNPGTFMRLSLGPEQRYAARGASDEAATQWFADKACTLMEFWISYR